jgi:hypothetical protein
MVKGGGSVKNKMQANERKGAKIIKREHQPEFVLSQAPG